MNASPLLIIITGAPATGKSTLAPLVASRCACTLISKDVIKEALFDLLGTGDATWSRRLSDASFATMFALAGNALDAGASVALEGNFRPGEHEAPLCELLGRGVTSVRCIQILCTAPESLRRARHEQRAHGASRHAGHLDAAAAFQRRAAGFLELPATRLEHASESSKATETLLAALDHALGPR